MFLLSGLMVLSCYQIYLFRIAGSYIPISALFMAMCIPFVKVLKLKDPLVVLFSMSLLLNAISILWSPVIGLWEYQMVFGYIFLITYAAFKEIQDTELAGKLIKLFLMASAVNGVLIVIFRLRPEIETVFILNFLNFFKNPDRLGFDTFLNVWDVDKAGGVFDNANTGAALHLVCVGLVLLMKPFFRSFPFIALLIINVCAVFFSGSKSALIILVLSSLFSFSLYFLRPGSKERSLRWFIIIILLFISCILLYYINDFLTSSTFAKDTSATSEDRFNLISFAYDMFWQHPLIGLGYGGWQIKIGILGAQYGVRPDWPPHNSIIEAWATAGIFNSLICISIIIIILKRSIIFVHKSESIPSIGGVIAVLGAVIMPLGDPQPFLGTPQLAAPLGIACCYIYRKLRELH
ncbi:O-antigen ligase family protein [Escherichia coli]|uniref:O-antigen ligase family protein n=1 Tax=Escherichia coli TaxID=562 RepID=UPI0013B04705|nr:O-antigen ligase family protein [Escherichia coli]